MVGKPMAVAEAWRKSLRVGRAIRFIGVWMRFCLGAVRGMLMIWHGLGKENVIGSVSFVLRGGVNARKCLNLSSYMKQAKALLMLLVLALAGMGAWVWKKHVDEKELRADLSKAKEDIVAVTLAKEEEMKQAISGMEQQHQKDLSSIMDKHQKELDAIRDAERKRMAESFQQFSDILDGNKQTLEYINLLEKKVKSGQAVSSNEADKLVTIAAGLSYLQKQYQKPFQEFTELEGYFAKRSDEHLETPNMRNAFWKRMFSRNFREQEREFYRTEGERRGFQEASRRFNEAYGNAQRQMKAADRKSVV